MRIEVEEICGFAVGQLDLGLATRSHTSLAIEDGEDPGPGLGLDLGLGLGG